MMFCGFDVTVNDVVTVCCRERLSNLRANLSDLTGIKGSMFCGCS